MEYHTEPTQRRLLGMTIPQIAVLGGILFAQVLILLVGAVLFFSPTPTPPPSNFIPPTPLPTVTIAPTLTPTAMPDFSGALLVVDDLPGYQAAPELSEGLESIAETFGTQVNTSFAFVHIDIYELIIGATFLLPSAEAQKSFDVDISTPDHMLDAFTADISADLIKERRELTGLPRIGDDSIGATLVRDDTFLESRVDMFAFRRGAVGCAIFVMYSRDGLHLINIEDIALRLDERIVEIIQNGSPSIVIPTLAPTPVAVSYDLTNVALTLNDLPAGFSISESEAELAPAGNVTSQGFAYERAQGATFDAIFGQTMLMTNTVATRMIDSAIQYPKYLLRSFKDMVPYTTLVEWQPAPEWDTIGERSTGWRQMGNTESGPVQVDLIIFRRGDTMTLLLAMHMGEGSPALDLGILARKLDGRIAAATLP